MINQVTGGTVDISQACILNSGENGKMAGVRKEQQQGRQPVDTVQLSDGKMDELPLTEREMKLLSAIKRHEFLGALSPKKVSNEKTVAVMFGLVAGGVSAILGAGMGAGTLLQGILAITPPALAYVGASAVEGVGKAREAENEWNQKFVNSSEKNSTMMVLEKFPQIGYRYQI